MGGHGGSTIFRGRSFKFINCTGNIDRLALPHSQFNHPQGTKTSCNNGAIIARSLHGGNGTYTSQLSITVTSELIGDAIECAYNNGTDSTTHVGMAIINDTGINLVLNHNYTSFVHIMSIQFSHAGYLSTSPDKIYISKVGFHPNQLIFQWNSVATDCAAVHYNILASNCGSCPTTTNHTNVTCTDVPADNNECNFIIQSVICRKVIGKYSNPISINTHIFYPNTAYIASISSLATFSVVSISALLIVMVIILMRSRLNIKAALDSQATTRAESSTQMESMYEEPTPSVSAINTRDNIAYGHTKTTTT